MRSARRNWRGIVVVSLLAVSLALLLPAVTGRPVVSYASSGSMEPTIGAFDLFFIIPYPRDLAVGDIIVYDSVTRGGPAVHRIVGGSADEGWITQGDANPTVDQQGGEPLVTRERILGQVVTRAEGEPVLVPKLGLTYVEASADLARAQQLAGGPRAFATGVFLLLAVGFGIASMLGRKRPERRAPMPLRTRALLRRLFPRGILGRHVGFALLVVLVLSTGWAASSAAADVELTMVVVRDPGAADDVRAQAPGGSLAREIEVRGFVLIPTLVVVEPVGARVEAVDESVSIAPRGSAIARVRELAGPETGLQHDSVRIWRYPAILPRDALLALHEASPGAPWWVAGALAGAVGAAWFGALRVARAPIARELGVREDWL